MKTGFLIRENDELLKDLSNIYQSFIIFYLVYESIFLSCTIKGDEYEII
jgi:phage-related holin